MRYSAKWRYQTYCGQMEVHSLQVEHFKITCRNGVLSTRSHSTLSTEQRKAEATAKAMKKLIRVAWTGRFLDKTIPCQALLQYWNTPSARDGLSPVQKLFGHPLQDALPIHPQTFVPEWQHSKEETYRCAQQSQEATARRYNATAGSLPDIRVGTHVAVQDTRTRLWDTYGRVTKVSPHRDYHI